MIMLKTETYICEGCPQPEEERDGFCHHVMDEIAANEAKGIKRHRYRCYLQTKKEIVVDETRTKDENQ